MLDKEFYRLYSNGDLENVNIYWKQAVPKNDYPRRHWKHDPGFTDEIVSFTYDGKYYLRIVEFRGYRYWKRSNGNITRYGTKLWSVTKEFDNKYSANAYFKKCSEGYSKISLNEIPIEEITPNVRYHFTLRR